MKIEEQIKNKEIEIAELNLKKLYGERGYREFTHLDLAYFLRVNDVVFPKRAYMSNGDYASVNEDGKLCIGGFEYNDRHREPYHLRVDKNGDLPCRESINGDEFTRQLH